MAKELWTNCPHCPVNAGEFQLPRGDRSIKIDQIIAGQSGGILDLRCPHGHSFKVDASDKSRVIVR